MLAKCNLGTDWYMLALQRSGLFCGYSISGKEHVTALISCEKSFSNQTIRFTTGCVGVCTMAHEKG